MGVVTDRPPPLFLGACVVGVWVGCVSVRGGWLVVNVVVVCRMADELSATFGTEKDKYASMLLLLFLFRVCSLTFIRFVVVVVVVVFVN